MLLPMLQRFLVSVLYRPLFNLTCGVISWQFSNFEALVIVHSCNLSPPRRLFEWGGPPNPPLPRQGWMSPLRMGGPPNPHLPRQWWMLPLRMGGPPKPPYSRARGGCRLFKWGVTPQTPPLLRQGWMSPLRMGGDPPNPPLPRQGWMSPLRMGGDPPNPPSPMPGVDVASSNGG